MAYPDHSRHDPYTDPLRADPRLRTEPRSGGAVAGLGVALGLVVLVIAGTAFLGGGDDASAPAPTAPEVSAPASDTQSAPVAPEGAADGGGGAASAE
ncbi:hypothetical protein ROJ8625_03048 [Roseivivax jejudonensis]|uniref:Uncharacterized protein n=1 Tax=Roseivivax jejudonensis TaxID=1529041 RepID=A0A1X6ZSC0_9RHOB|nr:hypothetical protein [Roseivivax jejudonensis]SLN60123.1 hypothetical protein ROJ8625_03048 [Roseivivax jejudonensis]